MITVEPHISFNEKRAAALKPANGNSVDRIPARDFREYIIRSEPEEEKSIISLGGANVLSSGNVLVVTGPPKGRKTMLASILARETRLKTAYIDSEQGRKHSWRTSQFIPRADVFHLRGEGPEEITRVIHQCANSGDYELMVIDNGRDILFDFNDVKESATLELLAKKVSEQVPLIIIIHENKNNKNGQGHAGYGLVKIAQTTIRVSLADVEDPSKGSFVQCVHSRDEPFKEVFLSMDGQLEGSKLLKAGGTVMTQESFFNALGDTEYTRDELYERIGEIFGISAASAKNSLTAIRKACPNAILERKEGKRKFYQVALISK